MSPKGHSVTSIIARIWRKNELAYVTLENSILTRDYKAMERNNYTNTVL